MGNPVNFPETGELAIGKRLEMPTAEKDILEKVDHSMLIAPDFAALKLWLLYS
jgi:hypothetical protein